MLSGSVQPKREREVMFLDLDRLRRSTDAQSQRPRATERSARQDLEVILRFPTIELNLSHSFQMYAITMGRLHRESMPFVVDIR